jgi:C4-dicarboxylate-specific signal transduction histidine kinase
MAWRTRRVVERAARAAVAAERAGQGLRTILHDHHDLRSVITSAQINADLLARDLGGGPPAAGGAAADLRDDLREIRVQLERVKSRVLEELATLDRPQPAAVGDAFGEVLAGIRARFPQVEMTSSAVGAPVALVAGGPATLRRILLNLVVNACEGDGRSGAECVGVSARLAEGRGIAFEVIDDGPGLPAHVLSASPGEAASTKPAGAGLGIGLVAGLVKASGGRVTWSNRAGRGARVVVELRAAE